MARKRTNNKSDMTVNAMASRVGRGELDFEAFEGSSLLRGANPDRDVYAVRERILRTLFLRVVCSSIEPFPVFLLTTIISPVVAVGPHLYLSLPPFLSFRLKPFNQSGFLVPLLTSLSPIFSPQAFSVPQCPHP